MKIIHIYSNIDRMHGAPKWLMSFASELHDKGYDSQILCPEFHIEKPYWLTAPIHTPQNSKITAQGRGRLARAFNNYLSSWKVVGLIPSNSDVIILHAEPTVSLIPFLRIKFPKAKIIYYCYQPPREMYDLWPKTKKRFSASIRILLQLILPIYKLLDRLCVQRAHSVLVWSNEYVQYAKDIYGPLNYVKIPAGVDFNMYLPQIANTEEIKKIRNGHKNVLLMNAALIPKKNIKNFIQLISRLKQNNIDAYGIIIGDGPLLPELKCQVEQLQIDHAVNFETNVSQEKLSSFYHASDMLLFLEPAGAWSMSIIEAGAAHLPVIAAPGGSMKTLVIDNKTGFLLSQPENNDDELYEKVLELINNKSKSNHLGKNNYEHCKQFSLQASAESFVNSLDNSVP